MKLQIIAFIIFNYQYVFTFGNWENQLNDYHIIPRIKLRFSRSFDINRKVNINTKYSDFQLVLKPTEDLFTHDFQSSTVDRHGRKTPIFVDRSQFYQGFVSGSIQSSVRAFFGSEDMISITIAMDKEIYQIESLSIYEKSNSSLLVYRYSDLKSNKSKGPLCPSSNLTLPYSKFPEIRNKRSVNHISYSNANNNNGWDDKMKRYCTIRLIADYRFFLEYGKGDKTRTTNYLIELMDSINQLFKLTEFTDSNNNKYTGYGFIIKDILIHSDWTVDIPGHFNEQRSDVPDAWDAEQLLNNFGAHDFSDVCVSHLFTYQSFSKGTLGLAWIGTWKHLDHGGICSAKVNAGYSGMKSVNTAWSTYKDSAGKRLISLSAYLVTAHELGHNWGADHDPDSKECSPHTNAGGKYVMYTYSVFGYENNNRLFSPCSKRSIGETISVRGKYCFKSSEEGSMTFCGNRRVENSEQCDIGYNNFNDICCTENCQLRPNSVCSPHNHECCTDDCKIKPRGNVCAKADPFNPCLGDAVCNGINRTCLPPEPLTGPTCTERGKCVRGRCRPFCETINFETCICDKLEETCDICCRNSSSNTKECQPAAMFLSNNNNNNNLEYKLNDGRPCSQGVCDKGVCKRKVNKLIERIWRIIDNLDTNLFVTFLLDNLVGTVILCSLLLWIPASVVVSCHDAKYRKLIIAERNTHRQEISQPTIF